MLEEEEPGEVPDASPQPRPPGSRRPLAVGIAVPLVLGALVIAQPGGDAFIADEVPSRWGDVPMTCDTLRIEQDGRAIERFRCRALRGLGLPTGVFESPESVWSSDITGRESRKSRIRISRDGEVTGWATY